MVAQNMLETQPIVPKTAVIAVSPIKLCHNSERRMSASTNDGSGSISEEEKTPEILAAVSKLTANYPLIPKTELAVHEQLGAGTFGSVFKGTWCSIATSQCLVVALKKVFMLEKEVDILSQIRHRNIIQFFGVSHANPDFYIVTEYAENGSLFSHLHNDTAHFSSERLLKWATQIGHGVQYLHYEAPVTIIHRDLKSKNVVIGHKMTCKLCDFGTSKDLTHSATAPTWGGTAAWMSPEIISQKEGITTATDVWSFGVLLWEMITREIPYKGLTEFKIYSIISQQGVKLVVPSEVPHHLADLLKECWHTNPKERINMTEVVSCLEAMKGDKELQKECAHFVEKKDEWVNIIQEQLQELDELKLDLARRLEELNQREMALKRRESSHRNFWQMMEYVPGLSNVMDWDEVCVVEWVQQVAADAAGIKDINQEIVDKIIALVLQYEIKGSRLLQVTEKDLERLGVENVPVRRHLVSKIDELRARSDDLFNFPSLEFSKMIESRDKQDKSKLPFNYPIILHVGMYSRVLTGENGHQRYRFKVFLDSDWEETKPTDSMPPEVHDSATVIKDVCISMASVNKSVLLETVRCICPPFGYLEWVDAEARSLPVSLTLAVTYTDQVIQPRNTRINVQIADLANPATLCSKAVPLKIRPVATDTSLSRINSSLFNNNVEKTTSNSNLQGVWRSRRRSFGVVNYSSVSPERMRKGSLFLRPQSTWSDVTASLRKSSSSRANTPPPPQHSRSIGLPVDQEVLKVVDKLSTTFRTIPKRSNSYMPNLLPRSPRSPPAPTSTSNAMLSPSPLTLQSRNIIKNLHLQTNAKLPPKIPTSKRWRTKSETNFESPIESAKDEEGHHRASFFVDPDSPSLLAPSPQRPSPPVCFRQTTSPDSEDLSRTDDEVDIIASRFDSVVAVKEAPSRCCANNCRSSKKPAPPKEEVASGTVPSALDKRPRRRKSKKQNGLVNNLKQVEEDIVPNGHALQKDAPQAGAQLNGDEKTLLKGCSQQVYGGYNKWRWKT